jgi:NADH-quinone oxidoreductase subunit C
LTESHPVLASLVESFESALVEDSLGQVVVRLQPEDWLPFAETAKEAGFEVCVDVTAVDWMRQRQDRFEVVANLLSVQHKLRLRMITSLGRVEPTVASLVPVWPGANFVEREAYDMFGITFEGHPDLTRILMPDEWEGHPLRKDFGVGGVPVQFKASHQVE